MTRFHFGTLRHEILHAQEHVVEYDWIAWISPLYPPVLIPFGSAGRCPVDTHIA